MKQKCSYLMNIVTLRKNFLSNINIVIDSEVPTIKRMFRSQPPINQMYIHSNNVAFLNFDIKPLIRGQINFNRFLESNKFDYVHGKI